jgi:CRP/FNR family transcriptional regulator, cyclic AMP receptor protein
METLGQILSEHPFLKGLDQKQIELITGCASNIRFDAGQIIIREGEEAEQFYIIRQGKVTLQIYTPTHGSIIIDTLTDGDVLGWSWLIPPYQWRFDAVASELTRAIALDGKCLRTKCEADHNLGYELLKRFAAIVDERLESTRIRLLDVYDKD